MIPGLETVLGGGGLSLGLSDSGSATSGGGGVNVGGLNAPAYPFSGGGALPASWMPALIAAGTVLVLVALIVKR